VRRIDWRIVWIVVIFPALAGGSAAVAPDDLAQSESGEQRFDTTFAPDGRYLAYLHDNERGGHDVKICDTETDKTHTVNNLFRWVKSLHWFEYRDGRYLLFDTPVRRSDHAYLKIFSVRTSRVVLDKRGWSFVQFSPDRTGFRFELRQSRDNDAPPSLEEVSFDQLILYDAMWIPEDSAKTIIADRLREVVDALASQDPGRVAAFVHPQRGLLVSTEAHVDREKDLVFTAEQIRHAGQDANWYTVGYTDGTGEPIELPLSKCLDRYVTGDLAGADQVGYNHIVYSGNTIVNTFESFPGSIVVEYYFQDADENPDFSWRSRRLVFEPIEGQWWLTAVTNDHWTI